MNKEQHVVAELEPTIIIMQYNNGSVLLKLVFHIRMQYGNNIILINRFFGSYMAAYS